MFTELMPLLADRTEVKPELREGWYPRKWNNGFIDMPVAENQRQPTFTGEEVSRREVAEQVGLGFDLPASAVVEHAGLGAYVAPNAPKIDMLELSGVT
jgi:hypothetical protein